MADAAHLLTNGVSYYVEAANMPAAPGAMRLLRSAPKLRMAGAWASGSGGVVLSALEMAQNSIRYSWSQKEVEERLKAVMAKIYDESAAAAAEYGLGNDLMAGSCIASFRKIAQAMVAQGC